MKWNALLVTGLLALAGCAAANVQVAQMDANTPARQVVDESQCKGALAEAFDAYEQEVRVASTLTFSSAAEAFAVIQTLAPSRIDFHLQVALARRGLTLASLAHYAETHRAFFDAQQRLYEGRLDSIQTSVATLAQHIAPMDEHLSAAD